MAVAKERDEGNGQMESGHSSDLATHPCRHAVMWLPHMGCYVVSGRMVFSMVVCHVGGSFCPVKPELALGRPAPEPVKSHPDHFDLPLNNGFIHKSCHHQVVCLDWRLGLLPPHFVESMLEWNHFSGGKVSGTKVGFDGRGHDIFHDL